MFFFAVMICPASMEIWNRQRSLWWLAMLFRKNSLQFPRILRMCKNLFFLKVFRNTQFLVVKSVARHSFLFVKSVVRHSVLFVKIVLKKVLLNIFLFKNVLKHTIFSFLKYCKTLFLICKNCFQTFLAQDLEQCAS
jgi:hypothetical protein